MDHNKLWKILQELAIPDHLTCLLTNLYAGQETTLRTRHGTMNLPKIGNRVCQGCILSPCSFTLYSEYTMWNAGLDEAQTRIKISGRNINSLWYVDDITFVAESKELRSLLREVKEESEKVGLEFSFQKAKRMAWCPNGWENNGNSERLYFLGLQNHCRWWLQPWK